MPGTSMILKWNTGLEDEQNRKLWVKKLHMRWMVIQMKLEVDETIKVECTCKRYTTEHT